MATITNLLLNPSAETSLSSILSTGGSTLGRGATGAVYAEPDTELDNLIESTEINDANDGAVVLISGLTRGALYEVSVIFTRSDGTTWTRTLAIRCVA